MQYVLGGELLVILAVLVAMGLCYCGVAFIDALRRILNIKAGPFNIIGTLINPWTDRALQRLSDKLGNYAEGLSGHIASNWHRLATIVDRTGWAIWHTNLALERLFLHVTGVYSLPRLWKVAHDALNAVTRLVHVTRQFDTPAKIITKVVAGPGGKALAQAVRAATLPLRFELTTFEKATRAELRALEAGIAATGDVALPVPAVGAEALRGALAKIRARLRRLENDKGLLVGTGLVAAALTRLGLQTIRCDNVKKWNRQVCRTDPALLDALLGSLAIVVGAQSVVRFANAMIAVEDEMVDVLESMIVEL